MHKYTPISFMSVTLLFPTLYTSPPIFMVFPSLASLSLFYYQNVIIKIQIECCPPPQDHCLKSGHQQVASIFLFLSFLCQMFCHHDKKAQYYREDIRVCLLTLVLSLNMMISGDAHFSTFGMISFVVVVLETRKI